MSKRRFTERHIPEGIRAKFTHCRDNDRIIFKTICNLIHETSGIILVTGCARVSPRDNPSKKIGRDISLGRALKEYYEAL